MAAEPVELKGKRRAGNVRKVAAFLVVQQRHAFTALVGVHVLARDDVWHRSSSVFVLRLLLVVAELCTERLCISIEYC